MDRVQCRLQYEWSCFEEGVCTVSHCEMLYLANHWWYYPEPACYIETVLCREGGSNSALLTGKQPPQSPKQDEPQTAVSPLLGLISVVYWWMDVKGWLAAFVCKHLWFQRKQTGKLQSMDWCWGEGESVHIPLWGGTCLAKPWFLGTSGKVITEQCYVGA